MEASFEVLEATKVCLTGQRMKVFSGARYEKHRMSGPGLAGRMLNCSACLGPFRRWDQEH